MSEERDRLAEEATKHLAERYDGRYHPRIVGQSWFKEGFDAGVESERKKAKGLVEALESYTTARFLHSGDDGTGVARQALAAYKQESERKSE